MCPLSKRRSSTFSISKLGYLASRAPSAMFSRSRKTAIVASEVLTDIQASFTLEPVVIEAYAYSLRVDAVGGDFMTQPTFKQQQAPRGSLKSHPGTRFAPRAGQARRRGHESIQARIFEFDAGRSLWHLNVVSAAQGRVRMQVQRVHRAARHDVDPAIGHFEFAGAQIPLDRGGKGGDVALEFLPQQLKGRRDRLKTMHRSVGGIAAPIVFLGPPASRGIVQAQLPALFQQLTIEVARVAALQGGRIDQRRK